MQIRWSSEETAQLRMMLIEGWAKPIIAACFAKYPDLKSAALLVAQFWDGEAVDAVHDQFIVSVLDAPDLTAAFTADREGWLHDPVNLPNLPGQFELQWAVEAEQLWQPDHRFGWDQNGLAIPAFAAFCKSGSDQDMTLEEAFVPYAIFRRIQPLLIDLPQPLHTETSWIEVEIVGQMLRPWLDGVNPKTWVDEWVCA